MKRSTAKLLSIIGAIIFIGLLYLTASAQNVVAMIIILLVYIASSIVLQHFQRCKACGRWPRKGDFFDTYCPRCGEPYED